MTTLSSSITPVTKIVKVMILIRKASLTSNKSYVRACEGQPGGAHTSCFHIHCNLEATRHQDPDWRLRLEAPQQEACVCLLGHRNLSLARSWQRVRKPLLRISTTISRLQSVRVLVFTMTRCCCQVDEEKEVDVELEKLSGRSSLKDEDGNMAKVDRQSA